MYEFKYLYMYMYINVRFDYSCTHMYTYINVYTFLAVTSMCSPQSPTLISFSLITDLLPRCHNHSQTPHGRGPCGGLHMTLERWNGDVGRTRSGSIHTIFNQLERTYANTTNGVQRLMSMVLEHYRQICPDNIIRRPPPTKRKKTDEEA